MRFGYGGLRTSCKTAAAKGGDEWIWKGLVVEVVVVVVAVVAAVAMWIVAVAGVLVIVLGMEMGGKKSSAPFAVLGMQV